MRLTAVSEKRGADEFWHSGANVQPYKSQFRRTEDQDPDSQK